MITLVIRPLQGYGNTASLSYPDTWVRKPDCLHLPYNPPLLGSSSYILCEEIFRKGPLVRRAEPYTHNPQQQYRLQQQASKIQALPQQQYKLQQHTVKTQVIRPPTGTTASPIPIQVRPLMWTTHPEGPSGNSSPCTILCLAAMCKNMGLTHLSEHSPPGIVIWGS